MQLPIQILEHYWNYTSFRSDQEEIIEAVLNNDDCLALLPTSGGKSICFQVPAMIKEGICIVVSPLIALMKDQVASLKEKGIKAMALTSEYSFADIDVMLDNCIYGNYKFLYLSPERLSQDLVQGRIRQMNVNLIAVDEAHCISQWGNDFRPAYKNIATLRELHPQVNCIALTATATKRVVKDIVESLDFIDPKIFKQSFFRSNLAYMVLEEEDKNYRIEQILKKQKGSAIIYVRNRKSTVQMNNYLESKGFSSTYYHGGLTSKEKSKHFDLWKSNRNQVMVATNAFGMGIDKPDVKTVIHINLPENIESYFQEAGRAGRNNEKAFSIILVNKGDELHVKQQFLSVLPSVDQIKDVYRKLSNYFQISYGEGEFTVHDFNFGHFCKVYQFNTLIAFNALQHLDRTSVIKLTKEFRNKTSAQVIVNNPQLFAYLERHPKTQLVLKSILRTYGGIFDYETPLNTRLIADKASCDEDEVIQVLQQLEKDELISLQLKISDAQIIFLQPREDDKTINRISKIIEQQNKLKQDHVQAVINYVNNDKICKSIQLLEYFGETNINDCGICSVCINHKSGASPIDNKMIIQEIHQLLKKHSLSSRAISEQSKYEEAKVQEVLKIMLERELIQLTEFNTYQIK